VAFSCSMQCQNQTRFRSCCRRWPLIHRRQVLLLHIAGAWLHFIDTTTITPLFVFHPPAVSFDSPLPVGLPRYSPRWWPFKLERSIVPFYKSYILAAWKKVLCFLIWCQLFRFGFLSHRIITKIIEKLEATCYVLASWKKVSLDADFSMVGVCASEWQWHNILYSQYNICIWKIYFTHCPLKNV